MDADTVDEADAGRVTGSVAGAPAVPQKRQQPSALAGTVDVLVAGGAASRQGRLGEGRNSFRETAGFPPLLHP